MIAYRCQGGGSKVNPYTISVLDNGVITPLKSSAYRGFRNNLQIITPSIIIGNNVGDISYLLSDCTHYDGNLIIPYGVKSCYGLFFDCVNLNSNILMPDSVVNCGSMFSSCWKLNQNIKISNSAVNLNGMFSGCENLNQNIKIPDSAVDMSSMFHNCHNLNIGNINIPENVTDVSLLFNCYGGYKYKINVYFQAKEYKNIYIGGMFGVPYENDYNNHARKNVFFNAVLNNVFNRTDYVNDSIISDDITWKTMTNGFYNA